MTFRSELMERTVVVVSVTSTSCYCVEATTGNPMEVPVSLPTGQRPIPGDAWRVTKDYGGWQLSRLIAPAPLVSQPQRSSRQALDRLKDRGLHNYSGPAGTTRRWGASTSPVSPGTVSTPISGTEVDLVRVVDFDGIDALVSAAVNVSSSSAAASPVIMDLVYAKDGGADTTVTPPLQWVGAGGGHSVSVAKQWPLHLLHDVQYTFKLMVRSASAVYTIDPGATLIVEA